MSSKAAATVPALQSIEDVFTLAKGGGVVAPLTERQDTPGRVCKTASQVVAGLRWALDRGGERGALLKLADGSLHTLPPEVAEQLDATVPTAGPQRALIAFVGRNPSEVDAARGEPLAGLDGDTFAKAYLAPLGLTRDQVLVTHLLPVAGGVGPEAAARFVGYAKAELAAWRPHVVVALGKAAGEELRGIAHTVLPHPRMVRHAGDSGELTRKLKKLRAYVDKARQAQGQLPVHIARKAETSAGRCVQGVALDPYQFDSQQDWCPPSAIRDTAWGWLENSRVIGFMHESEAPATVLESCLWPYPTQQDYDAAMDNQPHRAWVTDYGTDKVRSGAWVVTTRIDDPDLWQAIEAGEIEAYSIGGYGVRTPVDPSTCMPEVTFLPQVAPGSGDGDAST